MRNALFYLLFGGSLLSGFAQTYSVIHVSGEIYLPGEDTYLTRGLRLDAATKLDFQSENACAAVLSSDRGRYVIRQNMESKSGSDVGYVLSSVITPARGKMSTRSGSINNMVDFQKQFQSPQAWIADTFKVAVSPQAYALSDSKFFFVRYDYSGEIVNKRLDFAGSTLLFVKQEFYTIDDEEIAPDEAKNLKLYYYDSAEQTSTLITDLNLAPVEEEEILAISGALTELSDAEKVQAVHEWVSSLYGECSASEIEAILNQG